MVIKVAEIQTKAKLLIMPSLNSAKIQKENTHKECVEAQSEDMTHYKQLVTVLGQIAKNSLKN